MGILDTLFGTSYQTPGFNPNAPTMSANITGMEDTGKTTRGGLPNIFMTPNLAEAGLLGTDSTQALALQDALQSQATKAGLLSAGVSFLTQPRNLQAGSALPYLGRAYQQGMASAGDIYGTGLNQLARQQLLAQRGDRTSTIDRGDFIDIINENGETIRSIPKGVAPTTPKELSLNDQMDKIIFDITQKEQLLPPGAELSNEDKASLAAAQKVKLAGSTDPMGLQSTMLPGAKEGAEAQAKDFGKIANEWTIGNKAADASALIQNLEEVQQMLSTNPNITGGFIGLLPTGVRERAYPESIAAQERIEAVVQRGLKETLGAQFTEKEGEKLIKRAYNPSLSEEENLKRVNRLLATMKIAIQRKNDAVKYYYEHGNTLSGYDYKPITLKDFEDVLPETSVDKVQDEGMESLKSSFPKPSGMSDEEYQLILRNL